MTDWKPWVPPFVAPERREAPQPATGEQLDAIAADYATTMRALGFDVPDANLPVLRRAAAIQDAWRLAFARVLNSGSGGSEHD